MFAAVTVVVGFAYTAIWVIAVVAYSGFTYPVITSDHATVAYLGCIANFSVLAAVVVVVGFALAIVFVKMITTFACCGFAYAKLTADLAAVAYLGCIANFSVFAAVVVIVGFAIAIVVMEVAEASCLCIFCFFLRVFGRSYAFTVVDVIATDTYYGFA